MYKIENNKCCVIFVRVSTRDQIEGLSLEVQERLCRKKAEDEGYDVLEVIADKGISGFKDNRRSIARIKELILKKEISAVISLSSERLFRNSKGHMEMMEIVRKNSIRVIYINQASPEDNAASIMTDSMLANVNQFYRDQTSDKVKSTLYTKVEEGHFPSLPPIGYKNADNPDPNANKFAKKIIVPDPIAAPLISELFQLYSTGVYTVYDLTDMLNERGLRSHRGFKIASSVVFNILKNRIYLGEIKWGKAFNKDGKHKPLVDEATFNQVQGILDQKNHKACRRRKHQWLLSGFVICAEHQKRLVAEWHIKKTGNKTGRAYYHCQNKFGCGKYIEMYDLESKVEEKFNDLQFSDDFTNLVIDKTKRLFLEKRRTYDGRMAGLVSKRTAIEGKRKVAEDKLFEGILENDDFTRMRLEFKTDLEQINSEIISLQDQRGIDIDVAQEVLFVTKDISKAYKKASFNLKRQYLSLFWERFEVKDGVILKSIPSPLFAELLQAE